MDAWTVTYQKIAQSCALSQVLEAIFRSLEAQAILSNACRAIFHDETLVNANPEVKKENLHRFLSMWHSLTCDGAQNVFECETQTSSVRDLCRFRFFSIASMICPLPMRIFYLPLAVLKPLTSPADQRKTKPY